MNREELEAYILNHYATLPDYPWADTPRAAVFRHTDNQKWFALLMEVPRDKLGLPGTEMLDIVNFKCDPILISSLAHAISLRDLGNINDVSRRHFSNVKCTNRLIDFYHADYFHSLTSTPSATSTDFKFFASVVILSSSFCSASIYEMSS